MKTINFNDQRIHDEAMDVIFKAISESEWIEDYVDNCVSFVSETYFNAAVKVLADNGIDGSCYYVT